MDKKSNISENSTLTYWKNFRNNNPNAVQGYSRGAWACISAGDFVNAENIALQGIYNFPDDLGSYTAYAEASMKLHKYEVAFDRWLLVRTKFPDCIRGYTQGIWASIFLNDFQYAEQLASQAFTKFPDDLGVYLVYAEVAMKQSHYEDASHRWSILHKKFPNSQRGCVGLAKCLFALGELEEAKRILTDSIERFKDFDNSTVEINEMRQLYNSIVASDNLAYDKIISLGCNCEVSHRLKDYFKGNLDAYPFSWVYIPPIDYANSLFNIYNLTIFKESYFIKGAMFFFESGIGVHSKSKNEKLVQADGKINHIEATIALDEIVSRFSHMVQKLKKLNSNHLKIMFILKYEVSNSLDYFKSQIKSVVSFLKYILPNPKVFLLVIVEEQYWNEDLNHINDYINISNIYVAVDTVSFFALPHQTDVGGDINGWSNLITFYSQNFFSNRESRIEYNSTKKSDRTGNCSQA